MTAPEEVQLCALRVDDTWFAVDIMRVREIGTVGRITPVPGGKLDGVVEVRGQLAPVVDLRRRLGLPPLEGARGPRVVVVAAGGDLLAIVADRVTEVVRVPGASLKALPRTGRTSFVAGATRHQGRVLLLLDVKGLRPAPRRRGAAAGTGPRRRARS